MCELQTARLWADETMSRLPKTPNYTGLAADDRFLTGWVGEFAMRRWLHKNAPRWTWRVSHDGASNDNEFELVADGRTVKLELKTASQPFHQYLMFPLAQKVDWDICVGARIFDLEAGIVDLMGWMGRNDVDRMEIADVHIPTRRRKFSMLRPMRDLVELLNAKGF